MKGVKQAVLKRAKPKAKPTRGAAMARPAAAGVARKPAKLIGELPDAVASLTDYDKRKSKTEGMKDAPGTLKQEMEDLKQKGHGQDKTKKINLRIAAWKEGGWDHPYFQDVIMWRESRTKKKAEKAVPWRRMTTKVGGEENAEKMRTDGEIQAVPNPDNPDGRPIFKFAEYEVSRAQTLSRSKCMTSQKNIGIADWGKAVGFASGIEDMQAEFDPGSSMDLEQLPGYLQDGQRPALHPTSAPAPTADEMGTAMTRVSQALTNLIKMRLAVAQVCSARAANADHKKFLEQKVVPKGAVVEGLIKEYELSVKNKVIEDHPGPTTPADITEKLAEDSKTCAAIGALLNV
ncbi:unnamed protein product, partial [Prorocentrum cordatum]